MDTEKLAAKGRGGDNMVAHMMGGEMVIPPQVMMAHPELQEAVAKAFQSMGADPKEFVAGSPNQKINPKTGMPEFFSFGRFFRSVAPAVIGSLVLPGIGTALGSTISAAAGGAIGGGLGGLLEGGGVKGTALGALGGYGIGTGVGALQDAAAGSGLLGATAQYGALDSGSTAADVGLGLSNGGLSGGLSAASQALPTWLGGASGEAASSGIGTPMLLNAAANLYSGYAGSQAAKQMASAQLASTNAALAQQQKQYDQTQANLSPFLASGQAANNSLQGLLGLNVGNTASSVGSSGQIDPNKQLEALQNTPGYQFQLEQGNRTMNQNMAAQGGLFSGQALKAAQQFGQGLANNTYQQALQNYGNVAASGQNAAVGLGTFGQNYANSASDLLTGQGNIQANSINNQNNAQNQSLANMLGINVGGYNGNPNSQYNPFLQSLLSRSSVYGG